MRFDLGMTIREARERLGMTQDELAAEFGVKNGRTVRNWERANDAPGPVLRALQAYLSGWRPGGPIAPPVRRPALGVCGDCGRREAFGNPACPRCASMVSVSGPMSPEAERLLRAEVERASLKAS